MSWCLRLFLDGVVLLAAAVMYMQHDHVPRQELAHAKESHQWYSFRDDDAPLWCGKAYQPEWPAVDPGGRVSLPGESPTLILDLQCYTRMNAYFHGEEKAEVIFEFSPTRKLFPRAQHDEKHIILDSGLYETLLLSIGSRQTRIKTPTSKTFASITLNLEDLAYSHEPEHLLCQVIPGQDSAPALERTTELFYLPPREHSVGSFSKVDRVTGAVLLNSTTKGESLSNWTPFYPYGYYGTPKSLIDLAASGFNILHVIPDLPNTENFGYGDNYAQLLNEAADLGLWVMHDMRWTWQNLSLLSIQIDKMKDIPNLLTWYTGDEPDGTTDDPQKFQASTNLIRKMDSHYHIISAVFNCADFHFEDYTEDIDVVMTDPYPVGLVSTSGKSVYNTVCNTTYGCCGCDDCEGSIQDVNSRIDSYRDFLEIYDRKSPIWMVPQGFGGELHWDRFPTASEESAMQILGINHGAMGSVAWSYRDEDQRYLETRRVTSELAKITSRVTDILIYGNKTVVLSDGNVDVSLWENGTHALITYVNYGHTHAVIQIKTSHAFTETHHEFGTTKSGLEEDHFLIFATDGLASDIYLLTN